MIFFNIILPIKLHRLFVRKFSNRENGLCLNVSSSISTRSISWPYLSLYSASKCFLNQLSNSIDKEYSANSNIIFKTLITTYSSSYLFEKKKKLNEIRKQNRSIFNCSNLFNWLLFRLLPNKQKFISNLLETNYSTVGTAGYWLFELELVLIDNIPQFFLHFMLDFYFSE